MSDDLKASERPATEVIYEVQRYVDNAQRLVEMHSVLPCEKEHTFPSVVFYGHTQFVEQDSRTGQPLRAHPLMFPIDGANTLEEAFERFDGDGMKAAQAQVDAIREAQRQQHSGLIVPGKKR